MENMLGDVTLRELRGPYKDLWEKITSAEGQVWLEALKKFLRQEPTWADEMIYIPLEWSEDFGECDPGSIEKTVNFYNNSKTCRDWRLPTEKELCRALKNMKPQGFVEWIYYYTSTKEISAPFQNIAVRNHGQGLGSSPARLISGIEQKFPHLRLCREMKIPV